MSSRRWADQRGFTLVEVLVAAVVGAVVLLGMFSLYRATTTAFNQSNSQAYLQRQGTLALQEIARQAQRATKPTATNGGPALVQAPPVCAPAGSRSLQLWVSQTSPASIPAAEVGYYCYWASATGQLCEGFSASSGSTGPCRNLLAGSTGLLRQTGQTGVTLILQPDPRCPRNMTNPPGTPVAGGVAIAAGAWCLALDRDAGSTKGDVAFAITDGLDGMTFATGLMLRN